MRYLLSVVIAGTVIAVAACKDAPPRRMLPTLREVPSDERPSWYRNLPVPLERYPAPQGWGGDYLAMTKPLGLAG